MTAVEAGQLESATGTLLSGCASRGADAGDLSAGLAAQDSKMTILEMANAVLMMSPDKAPGPKGPGKSLTRSYPFQPVSTSVLRPSAAGLLGVSNERKQAQVDIVVVADVVGNGRSDDQRKGVVNDVVRQGTAAALVQEYA